MYHTKGNGKPRIREMGSANPLFTWPPTILPESLPCQIFLFYQWDHLIFSSVRCIWNCTLATEAALQIHLSPHVFEHECMAFHCSHSFHLNALPWVYTWCWTLIPHHHFAIDSHVTDLCMSPSMHLCLLSVERQHWLLFCLFYTTN